MIGRKHDCDLVSEDPSVSRRHALLRLTASGAEIVPLGRGWIEVNGKRHDQPRVLRDGDKIAVPGLELKVQIQALPLDKSAAASWRLVRARGGSFGVSHSPFVIGGDETDDLIVKRWPKSALQFHLAQGELYLETSLAKVRKNGNDVETEATEALSPGDEITFKDETFTVQHSVHAATTVATRVAALPSRIVIEMLPRGGRVLFSVGGEERAVFLADRRLDLVIALLRPPEGFNPGEFVSDEIVGATVWPRNEGVTRTEINVLISRVRRDLVEAGLAGARLIERAPGGGATRLALAKTCEIIIEG